MKKIGFLLSSLSIGGGNNVVAEYAARMRRHGYAETFLILTGDNSQQNFSWHPFSEEIVLISEKEAKEIYFNLIIATYWVTCYKIAQYNADGYAFFNQSVESRFYKENDSIKKAMAESAYLLGLNIITEASWIKQYLLKNYGIKAGLVLNGIRKDLYKLDGKCIAPREHGKLRVLVEGPLGRWFKNTEKTIELCTESCADEIWFLTRSSIAEYPGVSRVFSCVPVEKTPEIYRSCDVLIKLSYVEGMFGPPLEIFHCGGTAIVYDVSGHEEYIKDGYNAIVVKTGNEDSVIKYINYLRDNPALLAKLKRGALETAAQWYDWEDASRCFELELDNLLESEHCSRNVIHTRCLVFNNWELLVKSKQTNIGIFKLIVKRVKGKIANRKKGKRPKPNGL